MKLENVNTCKVWKQNTSNDGEGTETAEMEENSGKYVVYDGKIMMPRSIKKLKNHTIVRIVDRMMGGGKKKGQKKQDKEETTSSSESDALQDMFMSFFETR